MEPGSNDRRLQAWELGLERGPHGGGEPLRSLHDEVDHEGPAAEAELGLLPFEVGDGLVHLARRARAYARSVVQSAVHRRLAQAGLRSDLADPERVAHRRGAS
jgi:hypothetical protein